MNEERLNELEQRVSDYQYYSNSPGDPYKLTRKDFEDLIACARRCAELEAELDQTKVERNLMTEGMARDAEQIRKFQAERDALRADNERLREALYAACNAHDPNWEGIEQLLETTPADSLREYRNGVLEEVISQCGKWVGEGQLLISAKEIRAMKEADNETN